MMAYHEDYTGKSGETNAYSESTDHAAYFVLDAYHFRSRTLSLFRATTHYILDTRTTSL